VFCKNEFSKLIICVFAVRDLRERARDDADVSVRTSRGVPQVLRQDDPDGGVAAAASAALRHLQVQDPAAEAGRHRRRHPPHLRLAVLHGGGGKVGGAGLRLPLLDVFGNLLALRYN